MDFHCLFHVAAGRGPRREARLSQATATLTATTRTSSTTSALTAQAEPLTQRSEVMEKGVDGYLADTKRPPP